EFGGYKAGWVPQQNLSWEFSSAIRSSVEPFVVFLLIKFLGLFNSSDPFVVAFLMRLITALLCIACFNLWRTKVASETNSPSLIKWYDVALLLWFIPYMCVRSSSEIWSGSLFFISLSFIYKQNKISRRIFFVSGCLAALAFFIRFQTGFFIAGVLLFRAVHSKKNLKSLLWYGSGFLVTAAINVFLDHLFYQKWCFTPWNYFRENILHGRAAAFGTESFFYYVQEILGTVLPLQALVVISSFIIYIIRKTKDEITVAVLIFLAAHFISAHKEIRFLAPLIFIVPFIFTSSMVWFTQFKFS